VTDLLDVEQLGIDGLAEVVRRAGEVKRDPESVAGRLAGWKVGLFFEKPSTRTRVSSEGATADLGAHPIVLRGEEVGLGTREAVADVARVLDRYLDVLAFRVYRHADLVEIARHAEAPVINLLSDLTHPCQVLADLQTVAESRELAGTVLTFVGDGNNVCHSLMLGGAMSGMHVRVVHPPGHAPDAGIRRRAEALAATTGGSIRTGTDPAELVTGADIVYTDVWASMGQEDEADERREVFAPYQVDAELFGRAKPGAIFLHCLPAHRGEEVTAEVLESPRSRVFDQAENRLHAFKALLLHLAGR